MRDEKARQVAATRGCLNETSPRRSRPRNRCPIVTGRDTRNKLLLAADKRMKSLGP